MYSLIAITLLSGVCIFLWSQSQNLLKNVGKAKSSGFTYVIMPFHMLSIPWALTRGILLPLFDCLPESWTGSWVPLVVLERGWRYGYEPFGKIGSDTFTAVSPTRNILYTCDPDACAQLLKGRNFEKPAEVLQILNIFGPTITGTDGLETRIYRRITAPFFHTKTMQRVCTKSLEGTGSLVNILLGNDSPAHNQLRPLLARLTLHILNACSFESDQKPMESLLLPHEPPEGHKMHYSDAMHSVLDNFATIFLVPHFILDFSPFKRHRKARQSFLELKKYITDLRNRKREEVCLERTPKEETILDLLVRAGEGTEDETENVLPSLAVLGNIFIFMFAGHEASANTLHFVFMLLACNPDIQRLLQEDVERILNSRSIDELSYEADFDLLMGSYVGAVVNEALRLYPVLPFILKATRDQPQSLVLDGARHSIPPDTFILINTSAAHRNPKYWSEPQEPLPGPRPNTLAAFNPAAWLGQDKFGKQSQRDFKIPKFGSYVPFSDGSRGCLGTRFAMVELCTVVARIFSELTVELKVEGLAHDTDLTEKEIRWTQARTSAESELASGIVFEMSLRMEGRIPLSFSKKGEEKFAKLPMHQRAS